MADSKNRIQKEKEEFKAIKTASETEFETLRQKYTNSLHQIDKLKKEIVDKESIIELERKHQIEVKMKIKEALNDQTELDRKTEELKMRLNESRNELDKKVQLTEEVRIVIKHFFSQVK